MTAGEKRSYKAGQEETDGGQDTLKGAHPESPDIIILQTL